MKKSILLLFVGLWVCVPYGRAEVINRIVATVDGEPITLYELRSFSSSAGQRSSFIPPEALKNLSDRDLLDVLIMNKLVDKEVETQGLKAKDSDIDNYVERIKAQGQMNDEQFADALAKQGMTMEGYRQQVAKDIERALLVNREIGARVNVTPQDVERYYKAHAADFTQPEQVRVRHIFLPLSSAASTEEEREAAQQIQDIHKRALAGEDFATLADTYSQGSRPGEGGDLGYFKKGQMPKEIEDVAFSLKPGEVSEPFRTNAGMHLLKVEEHSQPDQQKLDEATTEEIKKKLYNDALRQRYERWFQEDLRFRHQVENFLTAAANSPSSRTVKPAPTVASGSAEETPPSTQSAEPEKKKGFFRRLLPF
ncbi:MAG TPA: peptidylprolyl isomerase [Candidatus Binatia bacterium]|jgi:peptidyl-prolyl cis-trans isomerase SurA|nr:peptidylprolyl isomerase [Candidatus Binatia bacterium]